MPLKSFWLPGYTSEIMSFSTILATLLDLPLKVCSAQYIQVYFDYVVLRWLIQKK